MSASPLSYSLEQLAEFLEALASRLDYIGEEATEDIGKLYQAAATLRGEVD